MIYTSIYIHIICSLLSAYDNCTSVKDKEQLLSSVKSNTRYGQM